MEELKDEEIEKEGGKKLEKTKKRKKKNEPITK